MPPGLLLRFLPLGRLKITSDTWDGCLKNSPQGAGDALVELCWGLPQPPPCSPPLGHELLSRLDATLHTALTHHRSRRSRCVSLLLYVKTREVFKYLLPPETPEAKFHLYKWLGFYFFPPIVSNNSLIITLSRCCSPCDMSPCHRLGGNLCEMWGMQHRGSYSCGCHCFFKSLTLKVCIGVPDVSFMKGNCLLFGWFFFPLLSLQVALCFCV